MEATVRHIFPKDKKQNNAPYLIAVALVSILIFSRCGDKGKPTFKPFPPDTTHVTCLFATPPDMKLSLDYMKKVTLDSVVIIRVDTVNSQLVEKKEIIRDSFYLLEIPKGKLKSVDGKDSLDVRGLPIMDVQISKYPKQFILKDYGFDPYKALKFLDSLQKAIKK